MDPRKTHEFHVQKNYKAWNILKTNINSVPNAPLAYKERDVWWVSLGHNIGDEEDGKGNSFSRPVLIVKGFSKRRDVLLVNMGGQAQKIL